MGRGIFALHSVVTAQTRISEFNSNKKKKKNISMNQVIQHASAGVVQDEPKTEEAFLGGGAGPSCLCVRSRVHVHVSVFELRAQFSQT